MLFGLLRNILLLSIGLLLAVIAVVQGYGLSFVELMTGENYATPAPVLADDEATSAAPSDQVDYREARARLIEKSFPSGKRMEILVAALEDGTPDSLQLVRREYIKGLPNYQDQILPRLKKRSLQKLLKLFGERDWSNWATASYHRNGEPSRARLYVNHLMAVNPELGVYLETAAQHFNQLYIDTSRGKIFDPATHMQHLTANAEEILKHRKQNAVPARLFFSSAVLEDPGFRALLAHARGVVVATYVDGHPTELVRNHELLASLDPRMASPEATRAALAVIYQSIAKASIGLRQEILYREIERGVLSKFAEIDFSVKKALAELYMMGALDAYESGDAVLSRELLQRSISTKSGLTSQRRLAQKLARAVNAKVDLYPELKTGFGARGGSEQSTTTAEVDVAAEASAGAEESDDISVGSFLWTLVKLILLLGVLAFAALVYFRNRQDFDYGAQEELSDDSDSFTLGNEGSISNDLFAPPEPDVVEEPPATKMSKEGDRDWIDGTDKPDEKNKASGDGGEQKSWEQELDDILAQR